MLDKILNYSDVFLCLGGNIGDTKKVLTRGLDEISENKDIELIKTSMFYKTSPVSDIPQRYYINCACHIKTCLNAKNLLKTLQKTEKNLGKTPKDKQNPRIIDIDIIFFGNKRIMTKELIIPHKEWKNRLFVLKPLSDLQNLFLVPDANNKLIYFDIHEYLKNFENTNNEKVTIIS